MNARQYVMVKFRPTDTRTYTYHNDEEPVSIGDKVQVDSRDGLVAVEVVDLADDPPPFATKPIRPIPQKEPTA